MSDQGANIDSLTGLYRRAAFHAALAREVSSRRDDVRPLALLLLDIDDLKGFNDFFGHQAGDTLLSHIAERLRVVIGPSDIVCRVGGDEFAVILPNPKPDDPERVYERIKADIADIPARIYPHLPDRGHYPPLSDVRPLRASAGIAWLDEGESPQSLYERADIAL